MRVVLGFCCLPHFHPLVYLEQLKTKQQRVLPEAFLGGVNRGFEVRLAAEQLGKE